MVVNVFDVLFYFVATGSITYHQASNRQHQRSLPPLGSLEGEASQDWLQDQQEGECS